jgi:S1/P1 Nuclease
LLCPRAFAWGCEGHQTVALIAKQNLNPHALAMVSQILTENPVDPGLNRFCQPVATDPIEDAATWADDYRKGHPETAGWHFIDIPRGSKKGSFTCDAGQGCITLALAEQAKILQDPASDPAARANALRFIIHFAGDIHQPLHCTTNNDRGGNCVPVTFFGQKPLETDQITKTFQLNLHGVWDTQLVEHIAGIDTVEQFAAAIEKRFKPQFATWKEEGVNFDSWAWESHEAAEGVTYGALNRKIPVETPEPVNTCADANQISERMLKLREKVGPTYQSFVTRTVEEQLAKAGFRLAMILNQIWPAS